MSSPWESAIANAINKQLDGSVEVKRRKEAAVLSSTLAMIMEMYKHNLSIIIRDTDLIHDILQDINSDDESLFYRDTYQSLIDSLKNSVLNEEYDDVYEKALEVLALSLEFYVDPAGFKAMRTAEDRFDKIIAGLDEGRFELPDDLDDQEGMRVSSLSEGDTKHFSKLTQNELDDHLKFLEKLKTLCGRLSFDNIGSRVERVIAKIRLFYGRNVNQAKENFTSRGYLDNPKESLRKALEEVRDTRLAHNFSVVQTRGMYDLGIKEIDGEATENDVNELVKEIYRYFYDRIIKAVDTIEFANQVKGSTVKGYIEGLQFFLDNYHEAIRVDILHDIIDDNATLESRLEAALNNAELNWAIGEPLINELESRVTHLPEDFVN